MSTLCTYVMCAFVCMYVCMYYSFITLQLHKIVQIYVCVCVYMYVYVILFSCVMCIPVLPMWEVKRQLRALGHPVTLFGETTHDRLERLKIVQLDEQERHEAHKGASNVIKELTMVCVCVYVCIYVRVYEIRSRTQAFAMSSCMYVCMPFL